MQLALRGLYRSLILCSIQILVTETGTKAGLHLPGEITDIIIDFCHSNLPVLLSCSLVCRQWLPASRYHLFRTLCLTEKNARSLAVILRSRNCTFTGAVHVLNIDSMPRLSTLNKIVMAMRDWKIELDSLSLNLIRYAGWTLTDSLSSLRPFCLLLSRFQRLSKLEIKAWYSTDALVELACAFPNLNNLSLAVNAPDGDTGLNDIHRLPKTLRKLELYSMGNSDNSIFSWLSEQTLPHLRSFHLTRIGADRSHFQTYLLTVQGQLQHLSITICDQGQSFFCCFGPLLIRTVEFEIPDLPQLRSLSLTAQQSLLPLLRTLISVKHSPYLQNLTIASTSDFEKSLWVLRTSKDPKLLLDGLLTSHLTHESDIDILASYEPLASLKNLIIRPCSLGRDPRVHTERFVRNRFPSWEARGVRLHIIL